jgi:hypothetical protein
MDKPSSSSPQPYLEHCLIKKIMAERRREELS